MLRVEDRDGEFGRGGILGAMVAGDAELLL